MTEQEKFRRVLKVELVTQEMNQMSLAKKMKMSPTTLSDWLRGAHPAPGDLNARIEKALKLPLGHIEQKMKAFQ